MKKQIGAWLLSFAILFAALPQEARGAPPEQAAGQAAAACLKFYPSAGYGTEWSLLGLLRSGAPLPEGYLAQYCTDIAQTLKEKDGLLHTRKYTEYARVALAVTAAGYDARNFGGYSLIAPLGEGDAVLKQGINGAIFALLALDCGKYPMPAAKEGQAQTTRGDYMRAILSAQTKDGGFALSGETADADVTAMALMALAPYQGRMPGVTEAVEQGIDCLSRMQREDGSFSSSVLEDGTVSDGRENVPNCESTAQVLMALCTLGISIEDPRFVKGGKTVVQALLGFQQTDGSFAHKTGGDTNGMATEQALDALAALERTKAGKTAFYDMTDVFSAGGNQGLPGKRAEITTRSVTAPGKTFVDITRHPARASIETLATYGILNGKSSTVFDPDATMTRAEFSTAVVRALGLTPRESSQFDDVPSGSWYSGFVGTAFVYGITKGTSSRGFSPNGVITREEAAVMICRTAALCGLPLSADELRQEQIRKEYSDGVSVSSWAREAVAICATMGWMPEREGALLPQKPILRSEVAEILASLLWETELLAN